MVLWNTSQKLNTCWFFIFADMLTACEMLLKVDGILDDWRKVKS